MTRDARVSIFEGCDGQPTLLSYRRGHVPVTEDHTTYALAMLRAAELTTGWAREALAAENADVEGAA